MLIRVVLFLLISISVSAQSSNIRFAKIDLEAAKQRASIEDKLIFIDTYTHYCKACKKMNREFANPKVAKFFNKHFINVKMDMDTEAGKVLKNKYQIVFLPTLLILDKHGNQRYKVDNVISADELLAYGKHYQEKYYPDSVTPTQIVYSKPQVKKSTAAQQKTVRPSSTKTSSTTKSYAIRDDEKVLHIMGQDNGDLPPEILKQEAYFRLQLMDGSHISAAQKYLKTQEDWSSNENLRFIFDFLHSVQTEEFEYLVNNKDKFSQLFGNDQVDQTIGILVNKELERAYPKPDLERAKVLFSYISTNDAEEKAEAYIAKRELKDNKQP